MCGPKKGHFSPAVSKPGYKSHSHFHLVVRLTVSGAMPLLHPHAVMAPVWLAVCHVTATAWCATAVSDRTSKHSLSLINNKLSLPINVHNCKCSTMSVRMSMTYGHCTATLLLQITAPHTGMMNIQTNIHKHVQ